MQLEFVSVEEFYFALTLAVKPLKEFVDADLVQHVRSHLSAQFGQPSTIAPGKQNTFNYVFRVHQHDNSPSPQLIVTLSDWQDSLRLSSDYGWTISPERKPIRTDRYDQRAQFTDALRTYLEQDFQLVLP